MKLWQIQTIHGLILLALIVALTGCAQISRLKTPMMAYYPPYENYLDEALSLVTNITFSPYNGKDWGRTIIKDGFVIIDFREELAYPINAEVYSIVIAHELAHVYENKILGIVSNEHKGWLDYFDYIELTTGKRPSIFPWG